jgi:hypothetical protein
MDILQSSLFTNNIYQIETEWFIVEDSFRQKAGIVGIQLIEYMINANLISIMDDDMYHESFLNQLFAAKNNEGIWNAVEATFPPEPSEPMSDEQEEMAAWAHAIRQQ